MVGADAFCVGFEGGAQARQGGAAPVALDEGVGAARRLAHCVPLPHPAPEAGPDKGGDVEMRGGQGGAGLEPHRQAPVDDHERPAGADQYVVDGVVAVHAHPGRAVGHAGEVDGPAQRLGERETAVDGGEHAPGLLTVGRVGAQRLEAGQELQLEQIAVGGAHGGDDEVGVGSDVGCGAELGGFDGDDVGVLALAHQAAGDLGAGPRVAHRHAGRLRCRQT